MEAGVACPQVARLRRLATLRLKEKKIQISRVTGSGCIYQKRTQVKRCMINWPILPFYFASPSDVAPKMRETMLNMPSSGAPSHQRTTDIERPTYPIDDLNRGAARL